MKNPVLIGTFVATLAFAGISIYWVQQIGHTGSKAVWEPKLGHENGEKKSGTEDSPKTSAPNEPQENGG